MKPLHGPSGRLRQHIKKIGAAHANRISSPNPEQREPIQANPASDSAAANSSQDFGEFSCKAHQDIYRDYCRKANEALSRGDTKMWEHWMNEADDFDRRKGLGRYDR